MKIEKKTLILKNYTLCEYKTIQREINALSNFQKLEMIPSSAYQKNPPIITIFMTPVSVLRPQFRVPCYHCFVSCFTLLANQAVLLTRNNY